jgi:hypothetical protein
VEIKAMAFWLGEFRMKFNPTFAFTATLLVVLMFSITAVSAWTSGGLSK